MKQPILFSISVFLLCISANILHAQVAPSADGGKAASIANIRYSEESAWAVFNNPAQMISEKKILAAVAYRNPMGVSGLNNVSFAFGYSLKNSAVGLHYNTVGYEVSGQSISTVSFAQKIDKQANIGLSIHQYRFRSNQNLFKNNLDVGFSLALHAKPTEKMETDVILFNPVGKVLESNLPPTGYVMLAYEINDIVKWYAQVDVSLFVGTAFKTGFIYQPNNQLHVGFGVGSNPTILSFGLGYQLKKWSLNSSFVRHHSFGFSPVISGEFEK
ncbi:MAG: hypothetical protein H6607_03190 [Flavobacteriales bacterium]|nr:hypothetical protein [Flavobacteriales bacterium]